MTFSNAAKFEAHQAFDDNRPSPHDTVAADVLGFVSAMCYRPLEDGEMVFRLMGEDGKTFDLRTNPVCAGRLAIAVLDLINRNGWFAVDLRVSDNGSDIARIIPSTTGP